MITDKTRPLPTLYHQGKAGAIYQAELPALVNNDVTLLVDDL